MCVHTQSLSHVWLFATLWTVACQVSLSMGFSRQEYWSGSPGPPTGDPPDPRTKPVSPPSLALQADSLLLIHLGSTDITIIILNVNGLNVPTKTQNGYKNKTPTCAIYKRSTLDLSTNTDWKRKARKRYSMQTEIKRKQIKHSHQIKQIHVDVRQRPTQYSGAIILQLKINNSLNVNLVKTKQSYFSSNSAKCTLLHF